MSVQLLQAHWGFTKMPFGRDLAPSMLHRHRSHQEAIARITWCIEQHHIGVITGEVGAGKTVAIRAATTALDASRHVSIYIANPAVGVRGLLQHIVAALGALPSFYTASLVTQAADALAGEHAERGRTPVLILDEAHLLDNAQMEAVRMLTNHDMDSASPMATLLVGQPTLRQKMRLSTLAALEQRIGMRYAMPAMSDQETRDYIHHHIKLALLTELREDVSKLSGPAWGCWATVPARERRGRHFDGSGFAGHPAARLARSDRRPVGAVPAA